LRASEVAFKSLFPSSIISPSSELDAIMRVLDPGQDLDKEQNEQCQ
jgi:hypothetical protein